MLTLKVITGPTPPCSSELLFENRLNFHQSRSITPVTDTALSYRTNVTAEWLALLLCFREAPGSNL
jgi:hypothetical protein